MAYLILNTGKLRHNYDYLNRMFRDNGVAWAIVSKLLCGNETYLRELIRLAPAQLCDARITNLKVIRNLCPEIETIYIRPVPPRMAAAVVRYADISFNTQYRTLKLLSNEAVKQQKDHRVIVMIEMGERREGVMRAHIAEFCEQVRALPRIEVVGIGTNFACLSGVMPSRAKLEQLAACRETIETGLGKPLTWISGGSSVAIPLLLNGQIPLPVNHFRVGETLFFGTDVYNSRPLQGLYQDVITLYAQIIELQQKPLVPDGEIGLNLEGVAPEIDPADRGKIVWRAILDVGLLDVDSNRLQPTDTSIQCLGASSDMLVVNLGTNPAGYKTGDYIGFRTDYMGALRLMSSRYVEKRVSESFPDLQR